MSTLINEILSDILTRLSQRCIFAICTTVCRNWNLVINQSIYYHTIHIYSKQQLIKFSQLAKEKKINNDNTIGYYVKYIILHYGPWPVDDDMSYLLSFPNLQQIDGLHDNFRNTGDNLKIYLQFHQLTDFLYSPHTEEWIIQFNNVKHDLKSLRFYFPEEEYYDILPQRQIQPIESIYPVSTIGSLSGKTDTTNKMLLFPASSLAGLVDLKIDLNWGLSYRTYTFPGFKIDEHTFENIIQSCPLLESLTIERIYMQISKEYQDNRKNNIISPYYSHHRLKSLHIHGDITNPECYTYFAIKFPQLESLYLSFYSRNLSNTIDKKQYTITILNMLCKLSLLKYLNIDRVLDYSFWPFYEFFKWLNLHDHQLTHLVYRYPLTKDRAKAISFPIGMDHVIFYETEFPIQQQFNYLNHLTSLTLDSENLMDLAFIFLSENNGKTVVSTLLEELKMFHIFSHQPKYIYIYDLLHLFPNLLLFESTGNFVIMDDTEFIDSYIDTKIKEDSTSYILHQLIEKKKPKLQQQQKYDDFNNIKPIYKLKSLKFSSSWLWFKNGFDELLKRCYQLTALQLENTILLNSKQCLYEYHLELSHLYLELLKLNSIKYAPITNHKGTYVITKLTVHETEPENKRMMKKNKPKDGNHQYTLGLKCKYIDALMHDFYNI